MHHTECGLTLLEGQRLRPAHVQQTRDRTQANSSVHVMISRLKEKIPWLGVMRDGTEPF
jgi:hypothetical protein